MSWGMAHHCWLQRLPAAHEWDANFAAGIGVVCADENKMAGPVPSTGICEQNSTVLLKAVRNRQVPSGTVRNRENCREVRICIDTDTDRILCYGCSTVMHYALMLFYFISNVYIGHRHKLHSYQVFEYRLMTNFYRLILLSSTEILQDIL